MAKNCKSCEVSRNLQDTQQAVDSSETGHSQLAEGVCISEGAQTP